MTSPEGLARPLAAYTSVWQDWAIFLFDCTPRDVKRALSDRFGSIMDIDDATACERLAFVLSSIGQGTLTWQPPTTSFALARDPRSFPEITREAGSLHDGLRDYHVNVIGHTRFAVNAALKQAHGPIDRTNVSALLLRCAGMLTAAADVLRGVAPDWSGTRTGTPARGKKTAKTDPEWKHLHRQYTNEVREKAAEFKVTTAVVNKRMVEITGRGVRDETTEGLDRRLQLLREQTFG